MVVEVMGCHQHRPEYFADEQKTFWRSHDGQPLYPLHAHVHRDKEDPRVVHRRNQVLVLVLVHRPFYGQGKEVRV